MTFHVGSQCLNPENWKVGLETTRAVFDQMLAAGLKPRLVNIGGGLRYWADSTENGPDGWGARAIVVFLFPR